jgi:hypothetical protein
MSVFTIEEMAPELCAKFNWLNLGLVTNVEVVTLEVESMLPLDTAKGQLKDEKILEIRLNIKAGRSQGFIANSHGVLWYKGRICVPDVKELKTKILREDQESTYSIHPGSSKMYRDLKTTYWWYGMKRDGEGLVPDLPRGRGRSIGGDLDIGEEGSEQMIVTLQSLHHDSISYQRVHT